MNYIIERINFYTGFNRKAFETLSLASRLNNELGLDGDDANDLLADIFANFGIKSGDYDHYRYFKPEGTDIFVFFRARDRRANAAITLGMLYEAAQLKIWDCGLLEKTNFSETPIYQSTDQIPIGGFHINSR